MKTVSFTLAITALAAATLASLPASAKSSRLEAHEAKIERRYEQSRRSGAVTYLEGIRIRRELANYRKIKASLASDGHLSRQERRVLHAKLREAGGDVRQASTNGWRRVRGLPRVGR